MGELNFTNVSGALSASVASIGVLGAGENHIGDVGGPATIVEANPVLTVAGLYAIGDFIGTSGTAITFANALRLAGETGLIVSAMLIDKAGQSKTIELWLFDEAPAGLPADNAAFTITDADAANCIGVLVFDTYYASALNSVSFVTAHPVGIKSATTSIFGCLVARAAGTWASLDLVVKLAIIQD